MEIIAGVRRGYYVTNRTLNFTCPQCGQVRSTAWRNGFGPISGPCTCKKAKTKMLRIRKSERTKVSLLGSLGGEEYNIVINDISTIGMNVSELMMPSGLSIGEKVSVSIFYGSQVISLRAFVRNYREDHSFGLEFVDFGRFPETTKAQILYIVQNGNEIAHC